MINLNGINCESSTFDWLNDSGFRYGYGCFETMLCVNGTIPLFDHHFDRLHSGLMTININPSTQKKSFLDRIQSLYDALDANMEHMICRIYVSGGPISPSPGFDPSPSEIITLTASLDSDVSAQCEFKRVTPTEFFKLKSMNYAHHMIELQSADAWPIYVDHEHYIIDSSIFAVGMILHDEIIFPKHDFQLPSVSRQLILDHYSECSVSHQPIQRMDFASADAVFGCNAVKGVFSLTLDHPQSSNDALERLTHWWPANLVLQSE